MKILKQPTSKWIVIYVGEHGSNYFLQRKKVQIMNSAVKQEMEHLMNGHSLYQLNSLNRNEYSEETKNLTRKMH